MAESERWDIEKVSANRFGFKNRQGQSPDEQVVRLDANALFECPPPARKMTTVDYETAVAALEGTESWLKVERGLDKDGIECVYLVRIRAGS